MSFRVKWMNKLDEDVYIVYNSILIRFNFLQCHFFKCLPYKIPAGHKIFIIFFQYPDHSQSQIEDGYRKEITFLFSHLIKSIVFTAVVDPWPLQLFAVLSLHVLWILGIYNYLLILYLYSCWSLVFTVVNVVKPWSLHLLMILGLYSC